MKLNFLALAFSISALMIPEASAVVSFTGNFSSNLKTSDGVTNIPIGTRYLIVVDTGGDGFGASTSGSVAGGTGFNTGSAFGDVNDLIIQASTATLAGRAATAVSNQPFDLAPYVGRQFGLIWFEDLVSGDTSVSNNDKYGFTRDTGWVMPAVAGTYGFTTTPSGSDFRQMGGAGFLPGGTNLVIGTVPEPSRMMLAALGALGVMVRRRRK